MDTLIKENSGFWAANLLNDLESALSDREDIPGNNSDRRIILDKLDRARIDILRALIVLETIGPEVQKAQALIISAIDGEKIDLLRAGAVLSDIRNIMRGARIGGAA